MIDYNPFFLKFFARSRPNEHVYPRFLHPPPPPPPLMSSRYTHLQNPCPTLRPPPPLPIATPTLQSPLRHPSPRASSTTKPRPHPPTYLYFNLPFVCPAFISPLRRLLQPHPRTTNNHNPHCPPVPLG